MGIRHVPLLFEDCTPPPPAVVERLVFYIYIYIMYSLRCHCCYAQDRFVFFTRASSRTLLLRSGASVCAHAVSVLMGARLRMLFHFDVDGRGRLEEASAPHAASMVSLAERNVRCHDESLERCAARL